MKTVGNAGRPLVALFASVLSLFLPGCLKKNSSSSAKATEQIVVGGQQVWEHDEGNSSGYFHTYDSFTVNGSAPRKVHIYLPSGYSGNPDKRYSVVYMNDGQNIFFNAGTGSWDVDETLDKLREENPQFQQPIVVSIGYRNSPTARSEDYVPLKWRLYSDKPFQPCCKAKEYANFVADDLKGFVDQHYRTKSESKSTFVGGSSFGGIGALFVAVARRDKIGNAIVMSPSVWVDTHLEEDIEAEPTDLLDLLDAGLKDKMTRPRIWLDYATEESEATTLPTIQLGKILKKKYLYKKEELFTYSASGVHNEATWGSRMPTIFAKFVSPD